MSKVVGCSMPGCPGPATHKVAAPWSYGRFAELKTYGLACEDHQGVILEKAKGRRKPYVGEPGETIGEIAVYQYATGTPDSQLRRLS